MINVCLRFENFSINQTKRNFKNFKQTSKVGCFCVKAPENIGNGVAGGEFALLYCGYYPNVTKITTNQQARKGLVDSIIWGYNMNPSTNLMYNFLNAIGSPP